ncbi:DUF2793 domain-containing protein [Actibacterium sp.]|uniref:DUF2793 domain-containing protein n=1 Tax=Actibacterium sp. TaxID=1872125 RepID=UPI003569CF86
MDETTILQLPLVQAAQAQKHVTVNEGLRRLDGLVQPYLLSVSEATPPVTAAEGDCHWVPAGAVNDWSGHPGEIAIFANGGWTFATPRRGWRGWSVEQQAEVIFDGTTWQAGALAFSPHSAAMQIRVMEFDHTIVWGSTNVTSVQVPSHAIIFGVTGRVTEKIKGTLTSWRLGTATDDSRYGSGLGTEVGSFVKGVLGVPTAIYADEPLLLTAVGGSFLSGSVRLAVHYAELTLPTL